MKIVIFFLLLQHKEAEFLQKLLPGYYMNLNQNPHTLLPKFFGMYIYQCNQKNIRIIVMNNLLPSNIKMHLKFDLKGSTFKRKVSFIYPNFIVKTLLIFHHVGTITFFNEIFTWKVELWIFFPLLSFIRGKKSHPQNKFSFSLEIN